MQIKEAFSKRRVRLMFVLTLINIGFAIFCTILSHQFGFIWLRDYNALNTLAYVLAAYLALKEILNWSRVIYLLTSNVGLAVIA